VHRMVTCRGDQRGRGIQVNRRDAVGGDGSGVVMERGAVPMGEFGTWGEVRGFTRARGEEG